MQKEIRKLFVNVFCCKHYVHYICYIFGIHCFLPQLSFLHNFLTKTVWLATTTSRTHSIGQVPCSNPSSAQGSSFAPPSHAMLRSAGWTKQLDETWWKQQNIGTAWNNHEVAGPKHLCERRNVPLFSSQKFLTRQKGMAKRDIASCQQVKSKFCCV